MNATLTTLERELGGTYMFDIWWGEIELTTLTLIISILVLFPFQLLLCFKVKWRIKRLLPIIILSVIELVLIYVYFATSGLEGLVYLIFAIFVGFMIFMCAVGWGVWGIIRKIKEKSN